MQVGGSADAVELAADWAEPMRLARSSLLLDADADGSRIIVVGERGHVLVSSDDGQRWQQARVPTRSTLTAVQIVDGTCAWAVGHDGVILKSDDGGAIGQGLYSKLDVTSEREVASLIFDRIFTDSARRN